MITIKSEDEIRQMREGGRLLAQVLEKLKPEVKPGITTAYLDKIGEKLILETGGKPSFKMVKGYRWATCMCVNEVVVHGIPNDYQLKENDLLGIDVGLFYQGFHTDMSWTLLVGKKEDKFKLKFLETGQRALKKAIETARVGNRIGHLSQTVQKEVEKAGFRPVKALTGHGIGKNLHEDPAIPCFLKGKIKNTPLLEEGMTLAIEVIYNESGPEVVYRNNDGWTIQTENGKLSGLFESTIAILAKGPIVLTQTS